MALINGNFSDEETIIDPIWHSGIESHVSHGPIKAVRNGHLVSLSGLMFTEGSSVVVPTNSVIFQLPVGFRPGAITPLVFYTDDNTSDVDLRVVLNLYPDGKAKNEYDVVRNYIYGSPSFHIVGGS